MEDIGNNVIKIEQVELLPVIMEKKNDDWRLAQICCAFRDGHYEVSYSFAKGYELTNYRLIVGKDETVASISRVYKSAILYENECASCLALASSISRWIIMISCIGLMQRHRLWKRRASKWQTEA